MMIRNVKKPSSLLKLPVIVWALTFTYGTVWLFILMGTEKDAHTSNILLYSLAFIVGANIIALITSLIASYYHENFRGEFLSRMYLMLSNIFIAATYFVLLCQFSKFLN